MNGSERGEDDPSGYLALRYWHMHPPPEKKNYKLYESTVRLTYTLICTLLSQLFPATDPGSSGVYSMFGHEKDDVNVCGK